MTITALLAHNTYKDMQEYRISSAPQYCTECGGQYGARYVSSTRFHIAERKIDEGAMSLHRFIASMRCLLIHRLEKIRDPNARFTDADAEQIRYIVNLLIDAKNDLQEYLDDSM